MYFVEAVGHILLFLLVFGMSATVDLSCVLKQMRNKRALCMGVTLQFVILPFLGFLAVKMFALDNSMGLSLLVLTSSPGGSYSNWWCSIFNADLALSVTMTAISTVIAVVMLPLNLYFYIPRALSFNNNAEIDIFELLDYGALMSSIVVVFSAVGLGFYASEKVTHPQFHVYANRFGSFAGVSLILLSGITSNSHDGTQIWKREASFYFGVASPCIIALIISNVITTYIGLKKPERITTSIECCYQNCGIATSVALSMFKGEDLAIAMGVPFVYGCVEFLVIGTYCLWAWKAGWTKAPPKDPFWKVVTTSYEVLLAEKLAEERNKTEIQLSQSYDVEVIDEYCNEAKNGGAVATCLYYCQEPDLEKVDPPAPTDGSRAVDDKAICGEITEAKADPETTHTVTSAAVPTATLATTLADAAEDDVASDDSYVLIDDTPLFWRSLGYKVQQ